MFASRAARRLFPLTLLVAGLAVRAQPAPSVEVTGERIREREPATRLEGSALKARAAGNLGATLQDELGVANASFGPNVGLPLIRGQGGSRVRALVGGIGTHDASTVSADHGVMVEPALAERIVVMRGPAVVRFGGGALGGAVEVDDGRVPQYRPDEAQRNAELRASERAGLAVAKLRAPLGSMVLHADVHGRRQSDVLIPGPAIDEDAVRRQFGLVSQRNTFGYIENSSSRSAGGSVGAGGGGAHWFAGAAASTLRLNYGIPPGGHSHDEPVAPGDPVRPATESVRIAARQQRLDLRATVDLPGSAGTQLALRASGVDYRHDEIDAGRAASTFTNRARELRAELHHELAGTGTLGLTWMAREFAALGEEAYVPRTDLRLAGLYAVQRLERAPWVLELGGRVEEQRSTPTSGLLVLGLPRALPARRFTPRSASFALERSVGGGRVVLSHWRAARAPDIQELYAGGPHLATRSFDFGNTALGVETLLAWDLAFEVERGHFGARGNAYRYRSKDYIVQRTLGWFYEAEERNAQAQCAQLERCLPATKREQSGARFAGFELELHADLVERPDRLRLLVLADRIRGRLVPPGGSGDVPRLPAPRWGFGLDLRQGAWQGELRMLRQEAQRYPGDNELPTARSHQVHAGLRHTQALAAGRRLALFVIGRNLTDQTVRNPTSFLRFVAPEPGRTVQAGLEVSL